MRATRFVVRPWRFSLAVAVALLSVVGVSIVDTSSMATASGVVTTASASPSGDSGQSGWSGKSCDDVFRGRPAGSLNKTTSAGPTGSTVLPGQTITVTLQWDPRDFGGHGAAVSEDCVKIGSRNSHSLSQEHTPGPNSGTDTFSYVIPDSTDGQQVCDRGALRGADRDGGDQGDRGGDGGNSGDGGESWGGGGQHDTAPAESSEHDGSSWGDDGDEALTSNVVCYTIMAAAAPEAPSALLFPVAGLVVVGGWFFLSRRRGRTRAER
jgi:hypothetical protein